MYQFIFSICLLMLSAGASAAPYPATSSSVLTGESHGIFRSNLGFQISAEGTDWVQRPKPKKFPQIATLYLAPEVSKNGVQASLSLRTEKIAKKMSLETYSRKWIKDYPRLGFDILKAQKVRVGKEIGFLIDLVNKNTEKQLCQVIFIKDRAAITLTCRDHQSDFSKNLKACNQIIRQFKFE